MTNKQENAMRDLGMIATPEEAKQHHRTSLGLYAATFKQLRATALRLNGREGHTGMESLSMGGEA